MTETVGTDRRPRICTAAEAVASIPDNASVASDGFTMMGVAEEIIREIERSFLSDCRPAGLTLIHAAGQSNRNDGLSRLAHPGLLRRIVGSHWGLAPDLGELLGRDEVEGICLPQGQLSALYRAIAAGRPGNLSTVGLGTFVDPRYEGGRVNDSARAAVAAHAYVDVATVDGGEYLLYRSFPIDVAILRASEVDPDGNASQREEAVGLDALSLAQAVRNSGGLVICQAKKLVPAGAIAARDVTVPATLIDVVVPATDPDRTHRQADSAAFDATLVSGHASSADLARALAQTPVDPARLKIGRRGAALVRAGDVINVGTGIPGDTIGTALGERRLLDRITLTIESGAIGGIPQGGTDFGVARHPGSIVPHAAQFDFYNGGGVDIAFMGAGQLDRAGNVNVSKLGGRIVGPGGFIDILDGARRICFLTSLGGKHRKFVDSVDHLTFNGRRALDRGQEVFCATEIATLRLTEAGWEVIDCDPAVDVHRDLLDLIGIPVVVSTDLREEIA